MLQGYLGYPEAYEVYQLWSGYWNESEYVFSIIPGYKIIILIYLIYNERSMKILDGK